MKHFMTGDCLIEVTEGAGLTVYILYANMTSCSFAIFKHTCDIGLNAFFAEFIDL
jgi:hypothetical protein